MRRLTHVQYKMDKKIKFVKPLDLLAAENVDGVDGEGNDGKAEEKETLD